jgi:hypothetical protein
MRAVQAGFLAAFLLGAGGSVALADDQVVVQSNTVVFHIEGMS